MHGKQNIKQHTEQHKHLRKSAGRAPSLRVIPWHLPFCKSRETLGYLIHKNINLENPKNYFMYRQLFPVGAEIFRTRPDRSWGPPSLLYNGYRVFHGGKVQPGCGVDHQPPSSAEVKERV